MKRMVLITLLILVTPISIIAANGEAINDKCIKQSGFVFDSEEYFDIGYENTINKIVNDAPIDANDYDRYGKIVCRQLMGIDTPGVIDDVVAGAGFNYQVRVHNVYMCTLSFEIHNYLASNDFKNKTNIGKVMQEENGEYQRISAILIENDLNNELLKLLNISGDDKIIVTFEDSQNSIHRAINSHSVLVNRTKSIEYIDIDTDEETKTITRGAIVFEIQSTYVPVAKKMIISGINYGDIVLAANNSGSKYSKAENKIFTDYGMGAGNYPLQTRVEYINNDWTIVSNCGYNIYNKGSVNKESRLSFRQISLSNPFPNQDQIGNNFANWEELGLITGDEFNQEPQYVIELDRDSIRKIRVDNKENKYFIFHDANDIEIDNNKTINYKSKFIHTTFKNIFTKVGGK